MSTEVENNDSHDPHFEPIVTLPEKVIPTLEEDEEVLFVMRAKLFRWAKEADPSEWKERGTGNIKLLKHNTTSRIRILMRRDKTFKICANHYLEKRMELVPNCNSDRAWMWSTFADFSEDEPKEELLAIRFLNAENANKFKDKFEECQKSLPDHPDRSAGDQLEDQRRGAEVMENISAVLSRIFFGQPDEEEEEDPADDEESEADEVARELDELTVKEEEDNEETSSSAKEDEKKNDVNSSVEDSPEK